MGKLVITESVPSEKEKILEFLSKSDFIALEQHPFFPIASKTGRVVYGFSLNEQNEVIFFCKGIRYQAGPIKLFRIIFGPIYINVETASHCFFDFIKHWHERHYYIIWQPLFYSHNDFYNILATLLTKFHPVITTKKKNQFITSIINLDKEINLVFKSFRDNHKRAIKKSLSNGLIVKKATHLDEIKSFALIYTNMVKVKSLPFKEDLIFWQKIFDFLREYNLGEFILVKNKVDETVGGVVVVYQGEYARYFKGASLPGIKQSILHPAMFEAIKESKNRGMKYFDLWGIDFYAEKGSQEYGINTFKRGFSKNLFFHPFNVHVPPFRGGELLYKFLSFLLGKRGII